MTKREGNMIVTTIKIKNLSTGAIAGLKVDEFWYDKDGEPVTGSQPFRWRKPLQPGEVIDVVLQGSDQSEDGPESVQVRARQRHDQGEASAKALDQGRHIRSAIDAATGIRHRRPVAACQMAATHSTTPASQIRPAAHAQNPNAPGMNISDVAAMPESSATTRATIPNVTHACAAWKRT